MQKIFLALFAGCLILVGGCRTEQSSTGTAKPIIVAPYTRVATPDSNTVQLQIALRKFVPRNHREATIWLASVMHVGEPRYYHELQTFLDAQTVVLFEGVNSEMHPRHVPHEGETNESASAGGSSNETQEKVSSGMQGELASALGLVFQLDAIDYDRSNFLNSDLSIQQLQRLMLGTPNAAPAQPGQPGQSSPALDTLMQVMDGSSFLGSLMRIGIRYIGSDPKLQALTKLTLIEAIGDLKGDIGSTRGLPPDFQHLLQVLIEARNENVISDLKTELKTVPREGSIAVFYGTGHMDDLEKRLVNQLNYRPVKDVWLTAFSVDLQKAKISQADAQSIRNLVRRQMEAMGQ